jgi:Secretory lipase
MIHNFNEDVLGKFFTVPNPLNQPEIVKVLAATTMGSQKQACPIAPMLIHQSKNDEVVPVATVDALVEKWGKAGANIQYLKDTLSEHVLLNFTSTPSAMKWIDDRLEGRVNPVKNGTPLIRELVTSLTDDEDEAAGEFCCGSCHAREITDTDHLFTDAPLASLHASSQRAE